MKPLLITGISVLFTLSSAAQAVTPVPQTLQLPPFHPQYQASQLDNSAIEEQFATPAQVRFEKVEMPLPEFQSEDDSRIISFSNAQVQDEFQCREHNGIIDQCFSKPAPKAKKASAVLQDQPNADDRLTVANLVLTDSNFKACVTTHAQQQGWVYADQVQWLHCFVNYPQAPIQDLTGVGKLINLQNLYVGGESPEKDSLTGFTELESLAQLNTLSLENYRVSSLDFIGRIPNLWDAGLHRLKVDGGWEVLASWDHLTNLLHSTSDVSDKPDIIRLINQMSGLKLIHVNAPLHKNMTGLVHPGLTTITTYDTENLNFLSGTPAVKTLNIGHPTPKDIELSALSNHRKLLSFSLQGTIIDAADIQQIQQQTELTHLRLDRIKSITSLAFVSEMPMLRNLLLPNSITDTNLATLTIPDTLTFLDLGKSPRQEFSYATLTSIKKIIQNPKKITYLNLNSQNAIPCDEITQIKAKIVTVSAPSQCGVKETKLSDVSIPDTALHQCISQHMVQQNASYLEGITYLNCYGVKYLTGIHHLTNLKYLSLASNNNQDVVDDLSPISQLSNLQSLTVQGQKLTAAKIAITYPASLTALEFRRNLLDQTAVPTLKALLPRLSQIGLGDNFFTDFNWISNAPNLISLGIGSNPVTSLSFIDGLPQLQVLTINNLNLTDLTGFTMPAGLRAIHIQDNKLTNLNQLTSRLANPALITNLTASNMNLADVSSLALMPNITSLELYGNKTATNYSAIGTLTKLSWLNLQEADLPKKFPDFTIPATLKDFHMTQYNATNITVTDISALVAAAGQFRTVSLQGQTAISCDQIDALRNHVNKAAFQLPTQCGQVSIGADTVPDPVLRKCLTDRRYTSFSNITSLSCTGNIQNWSGVQLMTNLQYVSITGTSTMPQSITNLSLFNQVPKLVNLILRKQGITDQALAVLGSATASYVNLDSNPITQASFSNLTTNFPNLTSISLAETAISSLSNAADLNVAWVNLNRNDLLTNYTGLNTLGAKTTGLQLEPLNSAAIQGLSLPATITQLSLSGDVWTSINQIFSKLTQPANLTTLAVSNNAFSDLTGIGAASKLASVYIYSGQGSGLADFSPVAVLTDLKFLYLQTPSLTSLTSLSSLLPKLEGFGVAYSNVTDFSLLKNMTQVKELSLGNTMINDLSVLHNLTNISFVALNNNNHLACSALDLLDSKKPANANISKPEFCTKDGGLVIQKVSGQGPTAVAFTNSADSALGQLRVETGSIIFTPAADVSGWVTLRLNVTYASSSTQRVIKIWVEPTDPPAKIRKGLPWWVLMKPTAV